MMRLRHRKPRKGHGLNGDPPMPEDQASARDDGFSGLTPADLDTLETARALISGGMIPTASLQRGIALAAAMRQQRDGLDDAELLAGVLPVAHWLEWAYRQPCATVASWGRVLDTVLAAAWELNGGGDE